MNLSLKIKSRAQHFSECFTENRIFIWIFSEAIHWKQNFISYISVKHSLKIDTSTQSFSEPFTENSINPLNPYVIAITLSVLKGCLPMQACTLSQRHSASAEVSTHWCWNAQSLVPKCLGSEVSWVRSVLGPKCPVTGYWKASVYSQGRPCES